MPQWGRVLGVGVLAGIVAYVLGLAINFVGTGGFAWYYATPWLWKPIGQATMLYSLVASLLLGVFVALAFESLHKGLIYTGATRGAWLGYLTWLVGSLPFNIYLWANSAIPDPVLATWALAGMVSYIAAGSVVGMALGGARAAPALTRARSRGRRRS